MTLTLRRHGQLLTFPMKCVRVSPFQQPFVLGVDFVHFFHVYLFTRDCEFRHVDGNFHKTLKQNITKIVHVLSELNIMPIFVLPGLQSRLSPFSNPFLPTMVLKILRELGVLAIRAPSDVYSQLAAMQRNRIVNAVMSSFEICFSDVHEWIHYLDIETKRAITLSMEKQMLLDLIRVETFSQHICSPFIFDQKIQWRFNPPLFNNKPEVPALKWLKMLLDETLPLPSCTTHSMFPQKCFEYFESVSAILITIFRNMVRLPLSHIRVNHLLDEFLPLMLEQNRIPQSVPLDENLIFQVLSLQNVVSRPFTTLFDTLRNVSSTSVKISNDTDYIITEATRRFMTALEYVAPGGGLSAWGRSVLVANSGLNEATVMFIELIRGDCIDTNMDSTSTIGVSVMEIIERTFSFFQCESSVHFKSPGCFITVVKSLQSTLHDLFKLITCGIYNEIDAADPIDAVLAKVPFQQDLDKSACTMMRFMFESTKDEIIEMIRGCGQRKQLKKDVKAALAWWSNISRASQELKQRSLKPNSRVSNLKNIIVLFECADEFVRKRSPSFMSLL